MCCVIFIHFPSFTHIHTQNKLKECNLKFYTEEFPVRFDPYRKGVMYNNILYLKRIALQRDDLVLNEVRLKLNHGGRLNKFVSANQNL